MSIVTVHHAFFSNLYIWETRIAIPSIEGNMISRNLLIMSLITLLSCGTGSENTHSKQYEKDISISQAQRYFHEQELGEDKVDTHDNHPYITAFLGERSPKSPVYLFIASKLWCRYIQEHRVVPLMSFNFIRWTSNHLNGVPFTIQ